MTINELATHAHEAAEWLWAVSKSYNSGSFHIAYASTHTGNESGNGNAVPYHFGHTKQKCYSVNNGANYSHNHTFTGTAFTFDNNPPYVAVYCFKRVA